jgi:antitoxin component HigA of HigAB toxin-antitoxin module
MQAAQVVTEAAYTQALAEIRRLVAFEPDRGTPEGERLEALTSIAEAFEVDRSVLDLADIETR